MAGVLVAKAVSPAAAMELAGRSSRKISRMTERANLKQRTSMPRNTHYINRDAHGAQSLQTYRRRRGRVSAASVPLGKRYEGERRVAPSAVGKRLVDEQSHTSLPRAAAAGTGMAAIAYGGSRSRMLGHGLRDSARRKGIDPSVKRALEVAEATRESIERATAPLGRVTGRGIGRMPEPLRRALNDVPRPLRPATATLAGAMLIQHARPVRHKTYDPVVIR